MCSTERFVCCHFQLLLALGGLKSAPFCCLRHCRTPSHDVWMSTITEVSDCIEAGNHSKSYLRRQQKVQRIFRFQFPFIVSSMNPIHPSTRVNISGSPIVSHDSYPLLTMPTIFFLPFLNTTNACPESPANVQSNWPRKIMKNCKPEQVEAPMPRPQMIRSE